jgi:hypothetical protein
MNPLEVSELLAYAAAAHPYVNLSKESVAVYVDLLGDLEYEPAKRAVRRLLALNDRFPTAAALRREVARLQGVLAPSATDALNEVMEQMQRSSRGDGIEPWSHPAIEQTVAAVGGLWRFRMSEQPDTLRAHFLKMYEKTADQQDRETVLTRGAGQLGSSRETRRAIAAADTTQSDNDAEAWRAIEAETLEDGVR